MIILITTIKMIIIKVNCSALILIDLTVTSSLKDFT